MDNSVVYTLIAVIAISGIFATSDTFAQTEDDVRNEASEAAKSSIPIIIETDSDAYTYGSDIQVTGTVATLKLVNSDITITIVNPYNEIVEVKQFAPAEDGSFSFTVKAAGDGWKYDGTYQIRAQYGTPAIFDKAQVLITGEGLTRPDRECVTIDGERTCIEFRIDGGDVTGITADGTSLLVHITATEGGVVTVYIDEKTGEILAVLVDGEVRDDVTISNYKITIPFASGDSVIEIFGPDLLKLPSVCSTGDEELCVMYSITGGSVTGLEINEKDNSLVFGIDAAEDGMVTFYTGEIGEAYLVYVNNQEWDDAMISDNAVEVEFMADTDMIEIFMEFDGPAMSEICTMEGVDEELCITYSMTGGEVTSLAVNRQDSTLVFGIDAAEDGMATFYIDEGVLSGTYLVIVDGEEQLDATVDSGMVTTSFAAGSTEIEMFGVSVIPEFGTVAALILAVAIVSIIAVSRTQLGLVPRY